MIGLVLDEDLALASKKNILLNGNIGVRLAITVTFKVNAILDSDSEVRHRAKEKRDSRAVVLGPVQQSERGPQIEVSFQCTRAEKATGKKILTVALSITSQRNL